MADSTPDASTGVRDDAVVEAILRGRAAHLATRDPAAESAALAGLAQLLADAPEDTLQRLADAVRALCGADAVVVAVREGAAGAPQGLEADAGSAREQDPEDGGGVLRWCVVSGALAAGAPAAGSPAGPQDGRWALDDCPCGVAIQTDGAVLFDHPARTFPSVRASGLAPGECLGVPWRVRSGCSSARCALRMS